MEHKSNIKLLSGAAMLLLAMLLIPLACDNVRNVEEDTSNKLSLEEVMLVHRAAMEQAKNNFNPEDDITGIDEKIDYFPEFNQSSIRKMNLHESKIKSLNSAIDSYKNMAVRFEYISLNKQKIVSTDPVEIQQIVIDDLESSGLFSSSEINLVRRISRSFELAEEGDIPPTSIGDSISVYTTFYKGLKPTSDESKYTVGVVLAIAEESYDWWSRNPGAIISTDGKSKAILLPTIVAQDVAGAIVGAGITAGYQLMQDEFDWGAVGWAAAGGAIVGSTGLVGRIAKWLS